MNAVIHKDLCLSDQTIESCGKVACGSESVVLLGIYRPHSDSIINFLDRIVVSLVGSLCNSRVNVIGDFNADFLDNYSNCVTYLTNSLNQLHFVSALNKQTRFIPNGADGSLLDHIWLNCPDMYTAGIILSDVTDHCPTFIIVKIPDTVKNEKVKISFRLVDELGMQEFESGLRCVSWSFSDDINESTSHVIRKLNDIYCSSFPIKIKFVTVKRLSKPWLSKAILNLVKNKSKYFKLYRLGLISQMIYNKYRNVLTSVIKRAKANYYEGVFFYLKII